MKRRTLNTSSTPKLVVETQGNLLINGWDEPVVSAETDIATELVMAQNGNVITITSNSHVTLRVPRGATCLVEGCLGQVRLQDLAGPLSVGSVAGGLALERVGGAEAPVHVESVAGEFSAHDIGGALTVQLIGGHAVVQGVAGACLLEQIGGHLELGQLAGSLRAQVGGNVALSLNPAPGQNYAVEAGGNILCALPAQVDAEVFLESPVFAAHGGDDVQHTILGAGGPPIRLEAGGLVRLEQPNVGSEEGAPADSAGGHASGVGADGFDGDVDLDLDLDDFGSLAENFAADLTAKIAAQLGALSQRLPGMLASAGLSNQDADEIGRRVQDATERASQKAQAKAQRAAEKASRRAERELARARRRAQKEAFRGGMVPPMPPMPPMPPTPPMPPMPPRPAAAKPGPAKVSAEERLFILQMLTEKKISVAQAEELLAALETPSN